MSEFVIRQPTLFSALMAWIAVACAPAPPPAVPANVPPFREVAGALATVAGCWEVRTRAMDSEHSLADSVAIVRLDSIVLSAEAGWSPTFRAEPLQGAGPTKRWARWGPMKGDSILVMSNYSEGWQFARAGEELEGQAVLLSDLVQPPDFGVIVLGQAHAARVACPTGNV